MLKKAAVVTGAAASLLALAPAAYADSAGDNGVNVLNDNDLSVLPIQACNDNVALLGGVIVPVLSPQLAHCVNAPVVDHPMSSG